MLVLSFAYPVLLLAAAISDLLTRRIPNWMTASFVLLWPFQVILSGMEFRMIGLHVAAGIVGLAVGFVLFALRYIGGGDAKVFSGACLWIGLDQMLELTVLTTLIGGVLAATFLILRGFAANPAMAIALIWIGRERVEALSLPYGVAIAAAAILLAPAGLTLI